MVEPVKEPLQQSIDRRKLIMSSELIKRSKSVDDAIEPAMESLELYKKTVPNLLTSNHNVSLEDIPLNARIIDRCYRRTAGG